MRGWLVAAAAVGVAFSGAAADVRTVGPVHIVDVERGTIVPDQAITITDGRITSIAGFAEATPRNSADRDRGVIPGHGWYAIPGLLDCHVHLNESERDAKLMIAYGVVAARDMGGATADRIALRERARAGNLEGLRLLVTGTLVDGDPPYHAWSAACGTPEAGRDAVRALAAAGVDQVKVYGKLKPEVHRAIMDEARARGLRCVGHVPDLMTVMEAARAGQLSNEHLARAETLFMPLLKDVEPPRGAGFVFAGGWWTAYPRVDAARLDETLTELAGTGMVQCPTLVLNAAYGRIPVSEETLAVWNRFVTPGDVKGWTSKPDQWAAYVDSAAQAWPHLLDLTRRLHQAGNPIVVGTDLANPYAVAGYSVHEEMAYLRQAGLTDADCLRAATITAARFLGMTDLGTIETGKAASFALIDRNPLEDIAGTRRIRGVFVNGVHHDEARLEQLKTEAEDITKSMAPLEAPAQPPAPEGEIVARGTFVMKWQQWETGVEDFALNRTPTGVRTLTVNRQNSFGKVPVMVQAAYRADGSLESARWETFALSATRGTVKTAEDGAATVTIERGGATERHDLRGGPDRFITGPAGALGESMWLRTLNLAIDEERPITLIELNARGGAPKETAWLVRRRADESIADEAGRTTLSRAYTCVHAADADGPRVAIWLDAEGVPVKRETTTGSLTQSAVRR